MFGVSHLRGFSRSPCVRFFIAMCLTWSVVLTGAFTVSEDGAENCLLLICCQSKSSFAGELICHGTV
jgi:hypothetical protein